MYEIWYTNNFALAVLACCDWVAQIQVTQYSTLKPIFDSELFFVLYLNNFSHSTFFRFQREKDDDEATFSFFLFFNQPALHLNRQE